MLLNIKCSTFELVILWSFQWTQQVARECVANLEGNGEILHCVYIFRPIEYCGQQGHFYTSKTASTKHFNLVASYNSQIADIGWQIFSPHESEGQKILIKTGK